jgi:phenylalanyl-tRNA synthetase beta chain
MFEKITGIKIEKDEMMKILNDLGFVIKKIKKIYN